MIFLPGGDEERAEFDWLQRIWQPQRGSLTILPEGPLTGLCERTGDHAMWEDPRSMSRFDDALTLVMGKNLFMFAQAARVESQLPCRNRHIQLDLDTFESQNQYSVHAREGGESG